VRKASTSKSWIAAFVIPVFLLLAGLGWWYVRRERRRTRAATKAFGDAMDEHDVRQRMLRLRLERVFGLDRIRDFHSPGEPEQADESKERERKRLRELLLPSYRRRREAPGAAREAFTLVRPSAPLRPFGPGHRRLIYHNHRHGRASREQGNRPGKDQSHLNGFT
jgi:hypothetical protein